MKNVTVSADRTIASVGGGARWQDVTAPLDAMNLSVAGGREAPVGVGGLTLGGGKSFFSSKVGFACDGVNSFEVSPEQHVGISAMLLMRVCSSSLAKEKSCKSQTLPTLTFSKL